MDFGTTREYSKEFMDSWLHLLQAGADGNREACVEWSRKLGYLTGDENEVRRLAYFTGSIRLSANYFLFFIFYFLFLLDDDKCPRNIDDPPGSSLQVIHAPAGRFRTRNGVG